MMSGAQIRNLSSMFFVSAGTLAFEIVLMRLFSVTFWHYFASLLIALALTGFGTAGSFLAVLVPRLSKHHAFVLAVTALSASLAMIFSYPLAVKVGLEPLALAWDRMVWLDLGLVCLILVVPFFLSAIHIGLILARSEKTNLAYAFNLAGSGAGCLAAVLGMAYLLPNHALYPAAGLTLLGFIFYLKEINPKIAVAMAMVAAASLILISVYPIPLRFEPFKERSSALAARYSQLEHQAVGLNGIVEVIGGPSFHFAPGLSLSCPEDLPPQKGLFIDGDLVGPITRLESDDPPGFINCLIPGLAFMGPELKNILIINPEGGLNLLIALKNSRARITAIEENPRIVKLMTKALADFTGNLYQRPGVDIIQTDPFIFLSRTEKRFDLILLGQGTKWEAGSSSGLGVSRLLTVEGLARVLDVLEPGGILALAGPLMTPPRASIRLFATAVKTLENKGLNPRPALIMARDWHTVLLLIKPDRFTSVETEDVLNNSRALGFDLTYLPGFPPERLPNFHMIEGRPLVHAVEMILSGQSAQLQDQSFFNLKPATRDRPYFFNFFRLKTLNLIIRDKAPMSLSVMEWGLLFTWGGLAAAILIAGAGIFLPLIKLKARTRRPAFFALIGLGYMLAEITVLDEAIFRVGNPALAVPLVIGIFLLLSGLGSYLWGSRPPGSFTLASAAIIPLTLAALRYFPGGPLVTGLILVPAALIMGAPFAGGLQHLAGPVPSARAWAFGINGFFSVLGSLAAGLLSLHFGHFTAILMAGGCYLLAALYSNMRPLPNE